MRRLLLALLLVAVAAPAQAKPLATITYQGFGVFGVEIPRALRHDAGHLWVTLLCRTDGVATSLEHRGVEFAPGEFPSTGIAGVFDGTGDCEAYAWVYPDAGTTVSNVLVLTL